MLEFNATFLIAMFSFIVFILIMNTIFYKPVLRIIRQREDYVSSNYEESKKFQASAKEFTDTHDAKIEQTQKEGRHEIRQIVSEAHRQANERISEAREHAKNMVRQEKDALLKEGEVLKSELKAKVVNDLACAITSKLLGKDISIGAPDYELVNKVMD